MKKITKTIIALSVLAGLASCAKDQAPVTPETENSGKITLSLTAGQENSETRAAIDATNSKVINWSADDKLSVFDGDNKNSEFTLESEDAGKSTGTFTGTVTKTSASGYTALYPYKRTASYDGTKISGVVLSAEQAATAGSFDPKAALMCAQSTSANGALEFKNIVGYVKFTTTFECRNITLISNTSTDVLAGTAEITPGDTPAVSATSGTTTSEVLLYPASGNIAAGTYYIALLPGTLDRGFKLRFTLNDWSERYIGSSNPLEIKSNGVINLGAINDGQLRDTYYIDLSASESANCYLVQAAGNYKFKAVQGNTFKKGDSGKTGTSVGTVASVEVLWESFGTTTEPKAGDLISNASYYNGYIQFSTPATFTQGNAVIAAKDASGTILWSWHIWCASEGWKEQVYYNNAGTMMDRNLGATSAKIPAAQQTVESTDDALTIGLLYQWGRKDPFLGPSWVLSTDKAASSTSAGIGWLASGESISENATKNPMTFYTCSNLVNTNCMPDGSWASTKTVNDPCPAGWRVPDGGSGGVWAKASGKASGIYDYFSITCSDYYGLNFGGVLGSDTTIWYPAAGYLDIETGDIFNDPAEEGYKDPGNYAKYWSVTPTSDQYCAYSFCFTARVDRKDSYPMFEDFRSYGYSVRCQKE